MKKTIFAIVLPILLLTSCNKTPVNEGPVSFKKFQRMAYSTINLGIMNTGSFTVMVNAYHVDPDTKEIGERDFEKSESFNYIINDSGATMYYKKGSSGLQYILEGLGTGDRHAYKKIADNWIEDTGVEPTSLDGYTCFAATVGVIGNQLAGKKNGSYKSNGTFIHYTFKQGGEFGNIKYRAMYDLETEKLTLINRYYYDRSGSSIFYYEVELLNIEYTGTIPEH